MHNSIMQQMSMLRQCLPQETGIFAKPDFAVHFSDRERLERNECRFYSSGRTHIAILSSFRFCAKNFTQPEIKSRSEYAQPIAPALCVNEDCFVSILSRAKSAFLCGPAAYPVKKKGIKFSRKDSGKRNQLFATLRKDVAASHSIEADLHCKFPTDLLKFHRIQSSRRVLNHALLQSTVLPAQIPVTENPLPSNLLVECFKIQGGSPLKGHVEISGAKNSALAVLAGSLCTSEEVRLRMVPDLHDVRRMFRVLQSIGVSIQQESSEIIVDARNITSVEPCPDVVRRLRASFFVIGALLGRQGSAVVPLPGGCNIGARPIDLHVRGLEALGARVKISQGKVHARVTNGSRLTGGRFCLEYPSVGATETLMMAASLADGKTILSNVAQEPEVVDLAEFLKSCGANIEGAGTSTIAVKGVKKLHGSDFAIIPDRIEAGTFLIAAAITRSAISMSRVIPHHLTSVIRKLESIGCIIEQTYPTCLQISTPQHLRSACLTKTQPFPGFPTDLQPQFMSLLTTCYGQSIIEETVFESRMRHVEELLKLGANVKECKNIAFVSGCDQGSFLCGAPVKAMDLRAGASLVLAGIAAEGTTVIEGVSHIDRGYEKFDEKLQAIGAHIQRIPCLPSELTI